MNPDASMTPMPISPATEPRRVVLAVRGRTPTERRLGRLLRAPDHDAGTAGGAPPASSPTEAGAPAAPAAAAAPPAEGAPTAAPAGTALPAATDASGAEISLLEGAAAAVPDGAQPAADPNAPPTAAEHVVPEAYELSVEGVDLDAGAIAEATPFFKEAGLSNDQANKIMPAAVKFRDTVANQTLQQIVDQGAAQKSAWAEETRGDPLIGGGKLDETLHLAGKGLDALGYPEGSPFRTVLTETGFGNHPEMVRIMRRVGEMVSEDGFPRAHANSASTLPAEKRLYPND